MNLNYQRVIQLHTELEMVEGTVSCRVELGRPILVLAVVGHEKVMAICGLDEDDAVNLEAIAVDHLATYYLYSLSLFYF